VNKPILASSAPLPLPTSDQSALAAATDAVVRALDAASTACVLPGLLVHRLSIGEVAGRFIEASELPFATMFADKSVLDEDNPNYIGMYDGHLMEEAVRDYGESCDAVLTVGTMQTDFNTGAFTAHLDPARTIDIGLHRTTVGSTAGTTVYQNVEMADILGELAGRSWPHRAPSGVRPTSLGRIVNSGDDPISVAALYPRWADFLREDDILVAETGTCSMGLAIKIGAVCKTNMPPRQFAKREDPIPDRYSFGSLGQNRVVEREAPLQLDIHSPSRRQMVVASS
jgi:indolepyruvate decarboxylase